MIFNCCNENRKAAIENNPDLNGIDYLEVVDGPTRPQGSKRQRTLLITCLQAAPTSLKPINILITGGETIASIGVEWVAPAVPPPAQATASEAAYFKDLPKADKVVVVRLNKYGDFSPYTLQLVNDAEAASQSAFTVTETLDGFDPQLSSVTFNFKVHCGPEFDCASAAPNCNPQPLTPPPINYLAKDYTTFRQGMLDRMNQLMPTWNATSEADEGIMLAEAVAYACDQLSYRQDAVTTEAYLNTARSRISLRRHARLVDYQISEGCNARAWIQLNVSATTFLPRKNTRFYTTMPGMPATLAPGAGNEQAALDAGVVVFEPMQRALLHPEHNLMYFYTWGDLNCCLPKGATEATLLGTFPNLQAGEVLIFEEAMGPRTGAMADAELRHRCAVRLTAVATTDAAGNPLVDPLFDVSGDPIVPPSAQQPQPITEIQWSSEDALPFPVCISSTISGLNQTQTLLTNVTVVLGNVILADQGLTMPRVPLGTVPAPTMFYAPGPEGDQCDVLKLNPLPVRFNPQIEDRPLTQSVTLPIAGSPSTPDAVALSATAPVSLKDANGFITLQVSADSPATWPQYFGVRVTPNATPGLFDLAVLFDPAGGPAGIAGPVTLEEFAGLNLTSGSPNYAPTVLANSKFITVPPGGVPGPTVPASFPPNPTPLPNTGSLNLSDATGTIHYLTVQPTNPLLWPALFSVISQQQIVHKLHFNLLLLYTPPGGPQGVTPQVIVEQFLDMYLGSITSAIDLASDLISIQTFEGEPSLSLSATALMLFDANNAIPAIKVESEMPGSSNPPVRWTAAPDLLASGLDDAQFVVEIDSDEIARLRFGDGVNGKQPVEGDVFTCTYRVGNGTAGNVGANSLINVAAPVATRATIQSCINPMAAAGGIDPETAAQIVRRAPQAFMTQERAIIMPDYVNVVELNPQIEDANAQTRWTGSWYTVFIAAEPQANGPMGTALRRSLTRSVNEYRLVGQAAFIEPPQYIPLNLALTVCVDPDSFATDVEKQLLQVLSSCTLPNGAPAFFAPRNFKLGEPVYLSPIYAAARTVPGVTRVTATVFEPQGQNTRVYLNQGYIPMGPFQVARLDNDASLPGNGQLKLTMQGGR